MLERGGVRHLEAEKGERERGRGSGRWRREREGLGDGSLIDISLILSFGGSFSVGLIENTIS